MAKKEVIQDISWEVKDRTYLLTGSNKPLTLKIPSRHTRDMLFCILTEITNEQRELRYATNQNSPFKEEQGGEATLGHIVFKEGSLFVPKKNQVLQKILSLYHPLKGAVYSELDVVEEAKDELLDLELEIEALNLAQNIDVDQAEAIMRVEIGSKVSDMSSKELKRDLLLFAKHNPKLFIRLANDDNVQLRNFAIRALKLR